MGVMIPRTIIEYSWRTLPCEIVLGILPKTNWAHTMDLSSVADNMLENERKKNGGWLHCVEMNGALDPFRSRFTCISGEHKSRGEKENIRMTGYLYPEKLMDMSGPLQI